MRPLLERIIRKLTKYLTLNRIWPWLVITAILLFTAIQLQIQGRLWWCSCGYLLLWAGDIWSADNSQHLFDPYTFTHILHGVVFFWLLAWLAPRLSVMWRFVIAVSIEALWEIIENSAFIIDRYRAVTAALGYNGDTIINSLSDILMCGLGFWLTFYLGFRRSLVLFVVMEIVLLIWIRDSLILNVLMLVYPVDAIRAWQMAY